MKKDNRLFILYMLNFVLSIGVEYFGQKNLHITGFGIICMMWLLFGIYHDFMFEEKKGKKK